jgi:hypothetical protein
MLIKMLRRLGVSAGLTFIALLPVITPFFGRTHLMHNSRPIQSMTLAAAILLVVSTLVGTVVWTFIPSHSLKDQMFVLGCAVIFPICLSDLLLLTGRLRGMPDRRLLLFGMVGCFFILTWVRRANVILYRGLQRGTMVLFSGLGLCAAIIVGQLLFLSLWQPAAWSIQAGAPLAIHSAGQHSRVVWILFDELAFQQTYGHRDAHLPLPHLDALRQQSTLYTEVSPVGESTELVVPALLLGQQLSKVRYRFDNRLEIVPAGDSAWRPYSASRTLFAEARALGYQSGIVGWYNPYCSLLVGQWESCFWTSTWTSTAGHQGMSAEAGIFENLRSLVADYTLRMVAPQAYKQRRLAAEAGVRLSEYEALMEQARKLLSQPRFDFVFIHLSVPHPPAFYNRRTKEFGPGGSYLDSLALMDLALEDLLDEMKSSLQWPQTSIVISGDHSYRVPLWRPRQTWTLEDERATHGVLDDRPLLLIHKAGQQLPETVNTPTPLMVVHSVLEEMLRQNLDTPARVLDPAH